MNDVFRPAWPAFQLKSRVVSECGIGCFHPLSGSIPPQPPPCAGTHANDSPEYLGEMCLIREPAFERNLGKRLVSQQHHLLSAFNPATAQIARGGFTRAAPERVGKVAGAQAYLRRQVRDFNVVAEIGFHELQYPGYLPRRERPLGASERTCVAKSSLGPEQRHRVGDTTPCLVHIIQHSLLCGLKKEQERSADGPAVAAAMRRRSV